MDVFFRVDDDEREKDVVVKESVKLARDAGFVVLEEKQRRLQDFDCLLLG